MKVQEIQIESIRAMRNLHWRLPAGSRPEGWHVILGDNGAGKSSFLRALALGLIGVERSSLLWVNFDAWLRQGEKHGRIIVHATPEDADMVQGKGKAGASYLLQIDLQNTEAGVMPTGTENHKKKDFRGPWGRNPGWFSAGFGPFRRFTGGDREYDKLFVDPRQERLAAHLSLFRENVALTEALAWLQQLRFEELEGKNKAFFSQLQGFVNQPDFLPHGTQLAEVSSAGVFFRDANAQRIGIDDLSDGFRSVLSLTFELLRQLRFRYPQATLFAADPTGRLHVAVPGVVLIDEIDAHLHPIWQKRIGYWLTDHFPQVQFFVTTHSPLVCQAAELGTVFRLPPPGQTADAGGMVQGTDLSRLVYGNILEAYGTEVFGLATTQSASGQQKLEELAGLNQKALTKPLTKHEEAERDALRGVLPISESQAFVDKLLADL